jgi:hypothetical protein
MSETTEVDMADLCPYCWKSKMQCLCSSTLNVREWRKVLYGESG